MSSGIPPTSSVEFEGRVKGLTSSASKISFPKGLTSSKTGASLEKGLSSSFVSSTAGLSVGIVSNSVSWGNSLYSSSLSSVSASISNTGGASLESSSPSLIASKSIDEMSSLALLLGR